MPGDRVCRFHLAPQERRGHLAGKVGRSDIDPGVFVDTAFHELGAVSALLAYQQCAVDVLFVVDEQRTAFAGSDVLGFVKAQGRHVTDAPERATFIGSHQALGGILDHDEAMTLGDGHYGVHFAGNARVVNDHDRTRALRDRRLDQRFVDVERVGPDVDEHRHAAAEHKGVGRRDEGVGRHHHFIARSDVGQDGRHLECGGT